jgi:hypothetical protein
MNKAHVETYSGAPGHPHMRHERGKGLPHGEPVPGGSTIHRVLRAAWGPLQGALLCSPCMLVPLRYHCNPLAAEARRSYFRDSSGIDYCMVLTACRPEMAALCFLSDTWNMQKGVDIWVELYVGPPSLLDGPRPLTGSGRASESTTYPLIIYHYKQRQRAYGSRTTGHSQDTQCCGACLSRIEPKKVA